MLFLLEMLFYLVLGAALLGAFGFIIQAWAVGFAAVGLILLTLGG